MKQPRTALVLALAFSIMAVACGPSASNQPTGSGQISSDPFVFLSTQFNNVTESETGRKRCGFPAGPKSLLHRLIQGYLYPAYTGGLVTTYKNSDAVKMWGDLKDLWQYVNPQSLQIDFMQESLLSGQIWVGFDHVARLVEAFKLKPNDFIGVPAPKGPKGLYYMSVLAGLGIPKSSPNKAAAEAFIDYMTTPDVQ